MLPLVSRILESNIFEIERVDALAISLGIQLNFIFCLHFTLICTLHTMIYAHFERQRRIVARRHD